MSGGPKGAKRPLERPLDGGVRRLRHGGSPGRPPNESRLSLAGHPYDLVVGRPGDMELPRFNIDCSSVVAELDPSVRQIPGIRTVRIDDERQASLLKQLASAQKVPRISTAFVLTGEYGVVIARRNEKDPRHDERPGHAHSLTKGLAERTAPRQRLAQRCHGHPKSLQLPLATDFIAPHSCLTFDVSGGPEAAKQALEVRSMEGLGSSIQSDATDCEEDGPSQVLGSRGKQRDQTGCEKRNTYGQRDVGGGRRATSKLDKYCGKAPPGDCRDMPSEAQGSNGELGATEQLGQPLAPEQTSEEISLTQYRVSNANQNG